MVERISLGPGVGVDVGSGVGVELGMTVGVSDGGIGVGETAVGTGVA